MIEIDKINISQKLDLIQDHWHPRIIATLNGQAVKLAKIKGGFVMHSHPEEDELFLVVKGQLTIRFLTHQVDAQVGEIIVVPRGVQHMPIALEECHILLFEPLSTLNTGDQENHLTHRNLERI